MKKNKDYFISSGNVFADLGVENPEEELVKAKLAHQINSLIGEKGLTQTAAAKLLKIDQPKISALSKGKLSGFSLERLFRFLNILDQNITIKVTPKPRTKPEAVLKVNLTKSKKSSIIKPSHSPNTIPLHAQKKKRGA